MYIVVQTWELMNYIRMLVGFSENTPQFSSVFFSSTFYNNYRVHGFGVCSIREFIKFLVDSYHEPLIYVSTFMCMVKLLGYYAYHMYLCTYK